MFGKNELAKKIRIFLEENGIDPIYAVTILGIVISLSYWNYFKNWEEIEPFRKRIVISTLFGTSVLVIISILKLLGLINL